MALGAGTADNATFAQLMAAQAARVNPANFTPGSREYNLAMAAQTTGQNIQNEYDSPVGQKILAASARLGPNAGEKAIQNWMRGGPIDYGLAANSIDAQFHLGQLGGSLINNYMAGGGTAQVPVDFGGGMFGWTRDANGNYIAPQGDQSGITWNPATHRFEGDLDKATTYYMQGMISGNGLQGSAGTLNRYVNPQGKTWTGTQWIDNQSLPYMTADMSKLNQQYAGQNNGQQGQQNPPPSNNNTFQSLYNQQPYNTNDNYMPMGGYANNGQSANSSISSVLSQLLNRPY